jgi:hypothetical protein
VLHGDDARARPKSLPRFNSAAVRMVGAALTTVPVDLTD